MYCKHCGKEIDADSRFCKHCGKSLENTPNPTPIPQTVPQGIPQAIPQGIPLPAKSGNGLFSRFLSLSKKWQIILMLLILWILAWICGIFYSIGPEGYITGNFILCVIAIPTFILFIWHYFKHLAIHSNKVEVRLVMSYPLVDFANEHGKMQVAWDYNKKSRLYDMSFTFTSQSGKVIRVYPSEELKYLEPEQLPNYKSWLYVNEYSDGHYMLFLNMPQETNDQGITLTLQGVTSA